jgi:hypothetical protein
MKTTPFLPAVRAQAACFASVVSISALPALAQIAPERLSDQDVKALIQQVDTERDRFEDSLDGDFKGSTLRGPTGETRVAGALQDYQDSVEKLMERFTENYSASAEVAVVLKQATQIDTFMRTTQIETKGRSEWDRQVVSLKRLAQAYAATFPLPEGTSVRRLNDRETARAADAVAKAADRFKDSLGKVGTIPNPAKDAVRKDVDELIDLAETVRNRTNGGNPATAEMGQLMGQIAKVQGFLNTNDATTAMGDWKAFQAAVGGLQQAFGIKP